MAAIAATYQANDAATPYRRQESVMNSTAATMGRNDAGVPRKTPLARELLKERAFPGTRAQRLFLIMVDGRQPMARLAPLAEGLGVDRQGVQALVEAGLLEWVEGPCATAAAPAGPARVGRPARSLAAAKMYAIDLAALMLMGQDREVRLAARDVADVAQMHAWLAGTAARIAAVAGGERAALFLDKVGAAMPDVPAGPGGPALPDAMTAG